MLNVNELKRNAKNIVKKYSDAQVKVREATSNDPWGPSATIMAEIADMTHNVVAFSEIMQMIWKRLNDHGKNWRHVFKSLVLLEYLIKTGSDKVAQQCMENIFAIQTLKTFQYVEDNRFDHGQAVREKSKALVNLLGNPERLKAERARALKAKSRLVEAVSSTGKSSFGSHMSRSSNGSADIANSSGSSTGHNNNSTSFPSFAEGDSGSAQGSDIDAARPHSLTEEETQLQIALALSKEEAERQEKTRKNDELRLKLALDVSKKTSSGVVSSSTDFPDDFPTLAASSQQPQASSSGNTGQSNIDDLLGLSFTPTSTSTVTANQQQTQFNALSQGPFSNAILNTSEPQNDPWSVDPWNLPTASSALQAKTPSRTQTLPLTSTSVLDSLGPSTATITAASPPIVSTSSATTFPATQLIKPATSTLNQTPLNDIDSIFENLAPSRQTMSGTGQNSVNKAMSKNPFEY